MACYLFTFHAYGSWLPDHPRGYVVDKQVYEPSAVAGAAYRRAMRQEPVSFAEPHQQALIEIAQQAVTHIDATLHAVATEPTHVHILTSWVDARRPWDKQRTSIKRALTLGLKSRFENKTWLSHGSSRRRVRDREHFDHLVGNYLPNHTGWKWDEKLGVYLRQVGVRRN